MRENKIETLQVVKNNKIVGIIESDIFDSFINILGFKDKGSRITIETIDLPGILADVSQIFKVFNKYYTCCCI